MNAERVGELSAKPSDGFIDDPTGEDFATAAKWALQNKNWRLALEQAAAAAALDASHEPYLKLLDDAIRAARAPLELLKLPPSGAFYGLCAARGRALARAERFDEALEHVFRAACFNPATPFVPWAVSWLENAKVARRVPSESLALQVIELSEAARKIRVRPGSLKNLEAALEIVRLVRERQPSEALLIAGSRVLRALGRLPEAVAALERDDRPVTWEIACERAAIECERHDPPAQVSWLRRALHARPGDLATLVDLGEALLSDGSLDEALAAFAEARAVDATSASATIGEQYAQALARRASHLNLVPNAAPWSEAERRSAERRAQDLAAYASRLADPVDPLIGVIRGVLVKVAAEAAARPRSTDSAAARVRVRVRADRPLCPSARRAFELGLTRLGRTGEITVDAPDTGSNFGPLWDVTREPAAPAAPAPRLLEAVTQLAQRPFSWDAWRADAELLARQLAPVTARSILEMMAHVSVPPEGADPVLWVHGFQAAAALIASATVEPLDHRCEALRELLTGVDDWSAAAALLGLRSLVAESPEFARSLLESITSWLTAAPTHLQPSARVLAVLGSELGDSEVTRAALRVRARLLHEQREDAHEPR